MRLSDEDWCRVAHESVPHWHLEVQTLNLVSKSENIAFHVTDASEKHYVLRIHRPEYHTLRELVSEQLWTEALHEEGIDVPVAVRTRSGNRYAQVNIRDGIRNVGLLEWVEGRSLAEELQQTRLSNASTDRSKRKSADDSSNLVDVYRVVGHQLALLHKQASRWMPPKEFTRHRVDADGLAGEEPFWGRFWEAEGLGTKRRIHMAQMRRKIHELLSELPTSNDVFSLVHADLHTNNIIRHGSRVHLIDFDDAGWGWHAYDFAVALSSHQDSQARQVAAQALIDGYTRVRPLHNWIQDLIPLFGIVRACASIGWLDARPDRNLDPATIPALYKLASRNFDSIVEHAEKVIAAIE